MAHAFPTSSRVPASVLEKLHTRSKTRIIDEMGRAPLLWLAERYPGRIGFTEYTALQLFDKVLPPEARLVHGHVTFREHMERDLRAIMARQAPPRLVQLFSRYHVVYQGHVYAGTNTIYDVLALWLRIVAVVCGETRLWQVHLEPYLMDEQAVQNDPVNEIMFM